MEQTNTNRKKVVLDYSEMQSLTYKDKVYLFNPYAMGVGLWAQQTLRGKAGAYVDKETQKILNKMAFGYEDLPNMADRFETSSGEKKQRLRKTASEWLWAKVALMKSNQKSCPDTKPRSFTSNKGMMFFYQYSPKYKDKLPMWDKFPLVIILEHYGDGFLGLNLHYASEIEKTAILMGLLSTRMYDKTQNIMKLNINYDKLVSITKKSTNYQKCLKRYLTEYIIGNVLEIKPHEWGLTTFLPTAEFQYNPIKSSKK